MGVIGECVSLRARMPRLTDGGIALRCEDCGSETAEDASFCGACGSRVGSERLATVRPQDETCALPGHPNKSLETKDFSDGGKTVPDSRIPGPVRDDEPRDGPEGRVVAGCRILRKIGQGGMGTVYLAHHEGLDKEVVVKSLPGAALGEQQLVDRFQREARAAARLDHPNVVAVHNVVREEDGGFYIVMQYVRGESLHDRIKRTDGLPWEEAAKLMLGSARGLEAAHAVGVVHRDIKPGNIMISPDGRALLADFGLARYEDGEKLSVTGQMLGTPAYMPPELARGQTCDERSDLYSLGITFYHALTGQLPYRGSNVYEFLQKHMQEEPTPVSVVRPGIPDSVWHVVEHAMAKQPVDRYPSARALADDLERLLGGETIPRRSGDSLASASPSPEVAAPPGPPPVEAVPKLPVAAQQAIATAGLEVQAPKRRPAFVMTAGLSGCSVVVLSLMLAMPLLTMTMYSSGPGEKEEVALSRLDSDRVPSAGSPPRPQPPAGKPSTVAIEDYTRSLELDAARKSGAVDNEMQLEDGVVAGAEGVAPPESRRESQDEALMARLRGADSLAQQGRFKSEPGRGAAAATPSDAGPSVALVQKAPGTASAGNWGVMSPAVRVIGAPTRIEQRLAGDILQLKAEVSGVSQEDVLQVWVSSSEISTKAFLREDSRDGVSVLEIRGDVTLAPGDNVLQVIVVRMQGSPLIQEFHVQYTTAESPTQR